MSSLLAIAAACEAVTGLGLVIDPSLLQLGTQGEWTAGAGMRARASQRASS